MKNLDMLKVHGELLKASMEKINADILAVDDALQNGCFPPFQYDVPDLELKISWDPNKKRLHIFHYDENLNSLIGEKQEIRKEVYKYLDSFIVSIIEHSIGIQNPELKILKG